MISAGAVDGVYVQTNLVMLHICPISKQCFAKEVNAEGRGVFVLAQHAYVLHVDIVNDVVTNKLMFTGRILP